MTSAFQRGQSAFDTSDDVDKLAQRVRRFRRKLGLIADRLYGAFRAL